MLRQTVQRHPRVVILVGLALLVWGLYFYWGLLQDHGTFSPLFALMYTAQGPYVPPMPKDYKPTSRVVLSMTTMPSDVGKLRDVLDSLLNQTFLPAVIHINLPKKNRRTGLPYDIPPWLREYPKVNINEPEVDLGPLTKLYPSVLVENDPETLIVTVDDDKVSRVENIAIASHIHHLIASHIGHSDVIGVFPHFPAPSCVPRGNVPRGGVGHLWVGLHVRAGPAGRH